MKFHLSAFIPVLMTLVGGSPALSLAQTNKLLALVLPPTDWDAGEHPLASLVATNNPGDYPLPFTWVGVEKVTARSGWYARAHEMPSPRLTDEEEREDVLEFDKFTVGRGPAAPTLRNERFISRREHGYGQTSYRHSLPSDVQLLEMSDISTITNFLGWNPFRAKPTNGVFQPVAQEPGFRFFTLRPYNSLEILHVIFLKRAGDSTTIDGLLVRRARLHPQAKSQ